MASGPRVFIIHDLGKLNFLPAEEYGRVIPCIQGHVSPTSVSKTIQRLQKALEDITVDDYLVAAGHPALIAAAGAIQVDATGVLKMLCWDNQAKRYARIEEIIYDDDFGSGD